jgi:hypothetical protein
MFKICCLLLLLFFEPFRTVAIAFINNDRRGELIDAFQASDTG